MAANSSSSAAAALAIGRFGPVKFLAIPEIDRVAQHSEGVSARRFRRGGAVIFLAQFALVFEQLLGQVGVAVGSGCPRSRVEQRRGDFAVKTACAAAAVLGGGTIQLLRVTPVASLYFF